MFDDWIMMVSTELPHQPPCHQRGGLPSQLLSICHAWAFLARLRFHFHLAAASAKQQNPLFDLLITYHHLVPYLPLYFLKPNMLKAAKASQE